MTEKARKGRRANHQGSAPTLRKDGRWAQHLTVMVDGRNKRVTVYAAKASGLGAATAAMRRRLAGGWRPGETNHRYEELAELFLDRVRARADEGQGSPATWEGYRQHLRDHILPVIGGWTLERVAKDTTALEAVLAGARANRVADQRTLKHIFSTLRATLNYAVDQKGYISAHCVTEKNDRVKAMVAAPVYLQVHASEREAQAFVREAGKCLCALCLSMLVGFSLMMRKGEILGMRWQNRRDGKYTVREQLKRLQVSDRPAIAPDGFVVTEKVKWGSEDNLDLDPYLEELLDARRVGQERDRAEAVLAGRWREEIVAAPKGRMGSLRRELNDLILTDEHGEPIDGKTFNAHYRQICARAGITPSSRGVRGVRVHDFRGSVAEMLLTTGGKSPRAVMTAGRWRSPQMLMHYTKIQERHVADVSHASVAILFGKRPDPPDWRAAALPLRRPRRANGRVRVLDAGAQLNRAS